MSARYVVRGLLGVLLGSLAVVVAGLEIYHLVRTGSCASGGPYLSARPCPSGTGGRIFALIGAIFVLGPLSTFVFASRAKGLTGVGGVTGLVMLLWTCGWIAMGSAAYVAGHGPAHTDTSASGSTSVAITFWGIGGVSAVIVFLGFLGARRTSTFTARAAALAKLHPVTPTPPRRPAPVAPMAPIADPGAGDIAQRLKQLDDLKAMGAVTQSEYDAKRREILGDI